MVPDVLTSLTEAWHIICIVCVMIPARPLPVMIAPIYCGGNIEARLITALNNIADINPIFLFRKHLLDAYILSHNNEKTDL